MTKLPAKPTLVDAVKAIEQLHECFEEEKHIQTKRHAENTRSLASTNSNVLKIAMFLGVEDKTQEQAKRSKPLGNMTTPEAVLKLGTGIGGFLGAVYVIWKTVVTLAPGLWHGLLTLNHMVMS